MIQKYKIFIIFLICNILINGWCETGEQNEEEPITIGGYTYSINRNEKYIVFKQSAFESLDGIEQLEKLESLTISGNRVPLKDISAIGKLTELTDLYIGGGGGELRIREIIGASKLRTLHIQTLGTIDLEGIENFPELEKITLPYTIPINYEPLTKLQKLKQLYFNVPSQNTNLQFLTNIPLLEELTLEGELREDGTWASWDTNTYIDIDVRFLQELENLQFLCFRKLDIKNFNLLSKLPELNYIDIRACTTDAIDYSLFREGVAINEYGDR